MRANIMQKPLHLIVILLLVCSVLTSPVAGIPGCTSGCCMHDTDRAEKVVSFTTFPSHTCCCSASTSSQPCHMTETSQSVTGTFLPASGGMEKLSSIFGKKSSASAPKTAATSAGTAKPNGKNATSHPTRRNAAVPSTDLSPIRCRPQRRPTIFSSLWALVQEQGTKPATL